VLLARSAGLCADVTVFVHLGMALTFSGAAGARQRANLEQRTGNGIVRADLAGQCEPRRRADIAAGEVEADAAVEPNVLALHTLIGYVDFRADGPDEPAARLRQGWTYQAPA
jgi:hypothetical protein